jgi:hypothetical protein
MKCRPADRYGILIAGLIVLGASLFVVHGATASQVATSLPLTITKSHQLHDQGADIALLQKFLNAHGFVVAKTGPGSLGHETSLFGNATFKALKLFQAAQGLPATGYLGPLTRGKIAELPSTGSAPGVPSAPTPALSPIASTTCTAPAGLGCVPGTNIIQPTSPGNGYTPGFGGGGGPASSAPAVIPDTTAPTVSLTVPSNGSTVSGSSVTLTATSSDNVAVAGVQFKIDGSNVGASGTTSPYSITWNSTGVADGSHTIAAVAHDAASNYATSSITVTVRNNPPVISSISSATTTTSATITWTTNEAASSTVNYGLTSGYGTASTSAALVTSHSIVLTGLTAATTYHFQVASADGQGNTATSSDQTLTTAVAPILVSANRGFLYTGAVAVANSNSVRRVDRYKAKIGNADLSEIRFVYSGFYLLVNDGTETNTGNDVPIQVAMEMLSPAQTVQVTFSGVNQGTIVNGVATYVSDPIYPSHRAGLKNLNRTISGVSA